MKQLTIIGVSSPGSLTMHRAHYAISSQGEMLWLYRLYNQPHDLSKSYTDSPPQKELRN
jgi:hypothetical protein